MSFFKYFFFLFLSPTLFTSCAEEKRQEKWRHIEISPLDNSQIITVITKDNERYFMNGRHNTVPKEDYLLLDLSKVDRLGDGFSICWDDKNYNWKLASSYARLIDNKLDKNRYKYYQPKSDDDLPLSVNYKSSNCGSFLIRENRKPWGNLRVKYVKN